MRPAYVLKLLFFLINSESRRITPDAQVNIKKEDGHSFLDKRSSFINTATVCTFDQLEIEQAKLVGHLSETERKEVIKIVKTCDYLTPNQKEIVSKNLS